MNSNFSFLQIKLDEDCNFDENTTRQSSFILYNFARLCKLERDFEKRVAQGIYLMSKGLFIIWFPLWFLNLDSINIWGFHFEKGVVECICLRKQKQLCGKPLNIFA